MTSRDLEENFSYLLKKVNLFLNNFIYANNRLSFFGFFMKVYSYEKKFDDLKIPSILSIRGGGKKRKKKN